MQTLTTPDGNLIAQVLREVDFDQRLVGYRVRERTGPMPEPMYSFEEVVHLLADKCPYVDLKQLQQWVDSVVKDAELAAAIANVIQEETNDRDRMSRAKTLMGERLCQCKREVQS